LDPALKAWNFMSTRTFDRLGVSRACEKRDETNKKSELEKAVHNRASISGSLKSFVIEMSKACTAGGRGNAGLHV
jgi:hypothetical protein